VLPACGRTSLKNCEPTPLGVGPTRPALENETDVSLPAALHCPSRALHKKLARNDYRPMGGFVNPRWLASSAFFCTFRLSSGEDLGALITS